MTVQDAVRTVTVPPQAGPVDLPPAPLRPTPPTSPLLGRDRPLTGDERQFLVALTALLVTLSTFIVAGLLLAQYAWS